MKKRTETGMYDLNNGGSPTGMEPGNEPKKRRPFGRRGKSDSPVPKKEKNNKDMIPKFCAILAAITVFAVLFGIYAYMNGKQKADLLEQQTTTVVVATQNIGEGREVEAGAVTLQSVPKTVVPDNALTNVEDAVGKTTAYYISGNSVLTTKSVHGEGSGTLADRIDDNKVAITVGVTQQSGNAGLIHQGDFVTLLGAGGSNSDLSSSKIVEHARVLAVNSNLDKYDSGYASLTVEVTLEQAAKIATASNAGVVTFVLEPAQTS